VPGTAQLAGAGRSGLGPADAVCPCLLQDSTVVAGRAVEPHEHVADDHVFFWKAVIAEPCYWDSKASTSRIRLFVSSLGS